MNTRNTAYWRSWELTTALREQEVSNGTAPASPARAVGPDSFWSGVFPPKNWRPFPSRPDWGFPSGNGAQGIGLFVPLEHWLNGTAH